MGDDPSKLGQMKQTTIDNIKCSNTVIVLLLSPSAREDRHLNSGFSMRTIGGNDTSLSH